MKEEVFVECRDLSVGYRERSAAEVVVKSHLNLRAFSGEIVALIGGNGIGKSTLLKTIAGFQAPLSGELLIHQRASSSFGTAELARHMSFVSTEIVRTANLSVWELVSLGRFPYTNWIGQPDEKDHEIIDKAIRLVGLSGYENRLINRISDGERQRAMIARALTQDTGIIVLDEPTAFLDISNRYEIVRILHTLAEEQGKCIIFSTHDLNTALSLSDHIWLMLGDRVVEGLPEELAAGGYFPALFPNNPHIVFDQERGDFRIRKETKGLVHIRAGGTELQMMTRALERIGFEVVPDPGPIGGVGSPPDALVICQEEKGWSLIQSGNRSDFETTEQVCRMARRIRLLS